MGNTKLDYKLLEKITKEANAIREARLINDFKPRFIVNKVDEIKELTVRVLGPGI